LTSRNVELNADTNAELPRPGSAGPTNLQGPFLAPPNAARLEGDIASASRALNASRRKCARESALTQRAAIASRFQSNR
jgi:hypothetical protein